MNLDRITHPLRLAKGSHQPGSGKGCAMNAISYINGDAQTADFPACSARPLAALVQSCGDLRGRPDGYCYQKTAWSLLIPGGRQSRREGRCASPEQRRPILTITPRDKALLATTSTGGTRCH